MHICYALHFYENCLFRGIFTCENLKRENFLICGILRKERIVERERGERWVVCGSFCERIVESERERGGLCVVHSARE